MIENRQNNKEIGKMIGNSDKWLALGSAAYLNIENLFRQAQYKSC